MADWTGACHLTVSWKVASNSVRFSSTKDKASGCVSNAHKLFRITASTVDMPPNSMIKAWRRISSSVTRRPSRQTRPDQGRGRLLRHTSELDGAPPSEHRRHPGRPSGGPRTPSPCPCCSGGGALPGRTLRDRSFRVGQGLAAAKRLYESARSDQRTSQCRSVIWTASLRMPVARSEVAQTACRQRAAMNERAFL